MTFSIFWQILGPMRDKKISTDLNQIITECFRLYLKTLQTITVRKHLIQKFKEIIAKNEVFSYFAKV